MTLSFLCFFLSLCAEVDEGLRSCHNMTASDTAHRGLKYSVMICSSDTPVPHAPLLRYVESQCSQQCLVVVN